MKCFQTICGFRKKCIGPKCALYIVLYTKDEKDVTVEKPMCSFRASVIAQLDMANNVDKLKR